MTLRNKTIALAAGAAVFVLTAQTNQLPVEHPECTFFGAQHALFVHVSRNGTSGTEEYAASALTAQVANNLPKSESEVRTASQLAASSTNTIDKYLFGAMANAGVAPAPATTDYEFVRRVTLDLTGRIPATDAVTAFVNDTTANKRATLIDNLLASPQWIDKWTIYFGDFLQNNSQNTQLTRYQAGVLAFNNYIRTALTNGEPYDQMARELIAAQGDSNYDTGEINWILGGYVTGGPQQDIFDQQAANVADTWLGIAHVNCLLCHNGRGHLDALSLWGSQTTRMQAWGFASFMSKTNQKTTPVGTARYWSIYETPTAKDYPLNTMTGNRPARQPVGKITNVPPAYLFGGLAPASGQDYRPALAQFVTSDFQFARAAVNYFWKQFFEVGMVDPPDQFDPARLDPNNPPTAPSPSDPTQLWGLQPTNAWLLNALAQDFINSKYDVKSLMREIANSQAYQLSARYNGVWQPSYQNFFARKLVRRLWAEELHDAIAQSSGIAPAYTNAVYGNTSLAMQFQEPLGIPDGTNGPVNNFLNAFLRGNRDDQPRSGDGAVLQALDLMNDPFVMNRVQMSKAAATSLIQKNKTLPNDQLVNTLFLNVLSRYPTGTEMSTALANLGNTSTRNTEIENLLWSLYNKVDFIFNY